MNDRPDSSQRKAIFAPFNQSVIVTAPPGYGKTYVMPRRIEYLIKSGHLLPPERVLGLTFTNAAASEMKSRLENRINRKFLGFIDAITFHSFCYQVLCSYGNIINLGTNFGILLEKEKRKSFETFLNNLNVTLEEDDWYRYQEWEREVVLKLIDPISIDRDPNFQRFWKYHKVEQIQRNEIDFNHLLFFTHHIFQSHPEILEIYRRVYRYILVDEFQDTNPIQFQLLRFLVLGSEVTDHTKMPISPVFIFADDWQSIYRFLGAVPQKQIAEAKNAFQCYEISLTEDHRTSSPSLSFFGRILRQLENYDKRTPFPDLPIFILPDSGSMAIHVNDQVSNWVESGISLHEIAILARHKWQLKKVEGSLSFAFLSVPELQVDSLEQNQIFSSLIQISKAKLWEKKGKLHELLVQRVIPSTNMREGEKFIQRTLIELAHTYDLQFPNLTIAKKARRMVNEALLEINWGQQLRQLCRDKIFVGTLHSAKGLEFHAVALVHLDKNSFPYWRFTCQYCMNPKLKDSLSLEEKVGDEWRVFYVGVTRAREKLTLFSSATDEKGYSTPISCLITEDLQKLLNLNDSRSTNLTRYPIRCER